MRAARARRRARRLPDARPERRPDDARDPARPRRRRASICLTASVSADEVDELMRGRRGRLHDEGRGARPDRARGVRGCRVDEADRREHGDRPRLDRRLPGGAGALPELAGRAALRPLRRRELPRLRRHHARPSSTSGLPTATELPTTSQPTPGDFLAVYEELAPTYERILSLQLSSTLSGTFASAEAAAGMLGGDAVRVIDTRTVSAAIAMLALGVQRRLERGTTDEEIDALVERYQRGHGLLFTVDTLEYLARGGRIGRARRVRREPAEREADPHDPRRRGRAAQARARQREGVRRVPRAVRRDLDRRADPARSGSRTPPRRSAWRRCASSSSTRGRTRRSRSRRRSAPSSARTPGRARSASSGSRTSPARSSRTGAQAPALRR